MASGSEIELPRPLVEGRLRDCDTSDFAKVRFQLYLEGADHLVRDVDVDHGQVHHACHVRHDVKLHVS